MADLTPIPAEQRRAYYDALLAGRAEAQRLGYGLMDDRVFAAFHRALYGPMLAAARAEALEEAARAIEARKRPGITAMLAGGWNQAIEVAAEVARETAHNGSEETKP